MVARGPHLDAEEAGEQGGQALTGLRLDRHRIADWTPAAFQAKTDGLFPRYDGPPQLLEHADRLGGVDGPTVGPDASCQPSAGVAQEPFDLRLTKPVLHRAQQRHQVRPIRA